MKDKKFVVYKHENLINHKVYIGQTCQDVKDRWQGGNGYKKMRNFIKILKNMDGKISLIRF